MTEQSDAYFWCPEQDGRLLELRNVERKRWIDIALIFKRTDRACQRRYSKITGGGNRQVIWARSWSAEDETEAYQLRFTQDKSINEIASIMGRTPGSVQTKLDRMQRVARRVHYERPRSRTIPAHVLADRDRRLLAQRTLTAERMGDPAPGQSALDRKLALA